MNFAEVGLTYISVLHDRRLCFRSHRHRPVGTDAHHRESAERAGRSDDVAAGGRTRARSRDRRARQPATALCQGIDCAGVIRQPQPRPARWCFGRISFEIWTHGAIPYDATLAITLLLGMCVGAPAILALSYANYSNRGPLLLWTKSLQLAIFLVLSIVLIPRLGPLGAAIALVVERHHRPIWRSVRHHRGAKPCRHPLRHALFLIATMVTIIVGRSGPRRGDQIFAAGNRNPAFSG